MYQVYKKKTTEKQYSWNVTNAFKRFLKGRYIIINVFDDYRSIQNGIRARMQNVCKDKRLCCLMELEQRDTFCGHTKISGEKKKKLSGVHNILNI